MSVLAADAYQATLEALAADATRTLLDVWDWAEPYDFAGEGRFHDIAKPLAQGAASAAQTAAIGYAAHAAPTTVLGSPSALIVANAGTRLFDPFELIYSNLAAGAPWESAVDAGRGFVEVISNDAVFATARAATSDLLPAVTEWTRRAHIGACEWCLNLSGVSWPSAAAADFGHDRCKCTPVPSADVGDHNEQVWQEMGWDSDAKQVWKARDQRRSLRRQIDTADRRRQQAIDEQATETDPDRIERLSTREQEWETRAEAAAERLRILETGTHLLAA